MITRILALMACGLLLACESSTAPEWEDWSFEPLPQQSLISSEVVKTVLSPDGRLYSWGPGDDGTLGQGNLKDLSKPAKIPKLERVISYDQNGGMAFALTEDGWVYQWGHYMFSSVTSDRILSPTRATEVAGAVSIFAQSWRLYIVDEEGRLWRMDPSHRDPKVTPLPQGVPLQKAAKKISGGVGLYRDGTLFNLGESGPEEGGPVEGLGGIVDVHNNFQSTTIVTSDGTVWAWGHEPKAGLGDGVSTESSVPIQLPGLSGIRRISGQYFLRFAVKEDGTVWYWGILDWDEDHNPIVQEVPVQIPGITDAVDVAAHWEALIKTAAGELYVFETATLELTKVPGF